MLEKVDLHQKVSRKEYKERLPRLQRRLLRLQRAVWGAGISPIVVFEGWDAAGKGSTIRKLTERLEPRGFELHPIREPRTVERQMPWLWRHWLKVPAYGSMGIFDRSWYGRVLVQRVSGHFVPHEWGSTFREINEFERLLAEDRYVFCKFFFHISRSEQRRRFEALEADPRTAWHVDPEDWEHHESYDQYVLAIEEMLEHTETEWAPWTIVAATDKYATRLQVFETMVATISDALDRAGHGVPDQAPNPDEDGDPDDGDDNGEEG